MRGRGFTLIELLIVVAIIAILAAIAVPNFIEAQVRAKVSRAYNDLRTLGMAATVYHNDNGDWNVGPESRFGDYLPKRNPNWYNWLGYPVEFSQWFWLTTPVAYITSLPRCPFEKEFNKWYFSWQGYYRCIGLQEHTSPSRGWGRPTSFYARQKGVMVLIMSSGPDLVEHAGDGPQPGTMAGASGLVIYDATNGTVSWGDIYYGVPGVGFLTQRHIIP